MIISVLSSLKAQADELREIRRVFNQIDMNHDGSLTIDELRECLKDVNLYELFTDDKLESNEDDNEAMVRCIMTMCDVDGDNHISYHEFV
jgi:Ca2+-binding EF-hand superfamily protein